MTHTNASSHEQTKVLARQVLALLELNNLTLNEARDVLAEADRQFGECNHQVMDATAFRLTAAARPVGGSTAYTPKASGVNKALLNQSEPGVQGVNQVAQHSHGG